MDIIEKKTRLHASITTENDINHNGKKALTLNLKDTPANFSSPTGHVLATDPLNKTCARASLTHALRAYYIMIENH